MRTAILFGALCLATAANASVITFNFNVFTGDLGTSQMYTSGAYSITAMSFGPNNPDLYGKSDGGSGDENGLGLSNDGDHEITTGNFVQLDLTNVLGFTPFTITMDSTTSGETWQIYQSGTSGVLGSLVLGGTDESGHAISPTMKYLDFTVAPNENSWNVLLSSLTFNDASKVPEPGSIALLGGGLAVLGLMRRRRQSASRN